jgi:hypothetical protein
MEEVMNLVGLVGGSGECIGLGSTSLLEAYVDFIFPELWHPGSSYILVGSAGIFSLKWIW